MPTRQGIFETNSSSTHSVVIEGGTDFVFVDTKEPVVIYTNEFGWEQKYYDDWMKKASYALTFALNYGGVIMVADLKRVMEYYLKVPVTFETDHGEYNPDTWNDEWDSGYIDHQSCDEAEKIFTSDDTIMSFIFGSRSSVTTDNDNH